MFFANEPLYYIQLYIGFGCGGKIPGLCRVFLRRYKICIKHIPLRVCFFVKK